MTSKIEATKREMYRALAALKAGGRWLMKKGHAEAFEEAFEAHLAAQQDLIVSQRQSIAELFMTNRVLVRQVEALAEDADLLKVANRAAGDELRRRPFPGVGNVAAALGVTAGELLENVQAARYENR